VTQVTVGRLVPGARLGPYVIEELIAEGGQGKVFRARHQQLGRVVAIKTLLRPGARQQERFEVEARAAARLRHPAIVTVYEVGVGQDGLPFLVMDHVSGCSLATRVEQGGPLPPREAASLGGTLAQALSEAHRLLVLHRDIKPANVLLDSEGRPYLTDFGLAKELDSKSAARLTQSGAFVGTPGYAAPEQALGDLDAVDRRADVYGLGATLYTALTGEPLFTAESLLDVVAATLHRRPRRPSKLVPEIDRDLETIVLTCLEKEPDLRYQTAHALAEDLARYLNDEPILARPTPLWSRALRRARRHPRLAAVLALVAVVGVAFWAYQTRRVVQALSDAERQRELARQSYEHAETARQEAEAARRAAEASNAQLEQESALLAAARDEARREGLRALAGRSEAELQRAYAVLEQGSRREATRAFARAASAAAAAEDDALRAAARLGAQLALGDLGLIRGWREPQPVACSTALPEGGFALGTLGGPLRVVSPTGQVRDLGAGDAKAGVTALAPLPNQRLLVARLRGRLTDFELWDLTAGERLATRAAGNGCVDDLRVSAAGDLLLARMPFGTATFGLDPTRESPFSNPRELVTEQVDRGLRTLGQDRGKQALHAETSLAASMRAGRLLLLDLESGDALAELEVDPVFCEFVGGDLLVVERDGRVGSYARSGDLRWTLRSGEGAVRTAALDAAGERLALASEEGQVVVLDLASGETLGTLVGVAAAPIHLAFSTDGSQLLFGDHERLELRRAPAAPTPCAELVDGRRVYAQDAGVLIQARDGLHRFDGERLQPLGPPSQALASAGSRVATASQGAVHLLDGAQALGTVRLDQPCAALELSPGGDWLAIGGVRSVEIREVAALEQVAWRGTLPATAPCAALALHPSKPWIAAADFGGGLAWWPTDEGTEARILVAGQPGPGADHAVAIRWVGDRLLTASNGGWLTAYALPAGDRVARVRAHPGRLAAMDLHPRRSLIATASSAGELALWDAVRLRRLRRIRLSEGGLSCAFGSGDTLWALSGKLALTAQPSRLYRLELQVAELSGFDEDPEGAVDAALRPD
jgi:hypothetical protein